MSAKAWLQSPAQTLAEPMVAYMVRTTLHDYMDPSQT